MNLHPLGMKGVLHVGSHYANVGAHGRYRDVIREALARRLGICLSDREPAYDFEHQVAGFIAHVSGVQEIQKFRVRFEPSVRISVRLVTNSIRLFTMGRVHGCTGHRGTLVLYDEALRMVDMIPQAGVTLRVWWLGSGWCSGSSCGCGRCRRGLRKADISGEDPANLVVLGPNVIEAAVWTGIHQRHPSAL